MNDSQAMLERSMRSVFVGNIPFDLTEERLKEIFSEAGPVLSFKLVYDRENGKPKGYGFCEYKDIETANSAMRNLNGYEISGRSLKVDNAANEKTRMELQNSLAEPVIVNPFDHIDPEKVPEAISKGVASLPPEQMFELMKQMKQCIQNNPAEARTMLLQNPQLAYGLLQAMVVMKIVDPEMALTMLSKPHGALDMTNLEPRPVQPPNNIQQPPPMQQHQPPPHFMNQQVPSNNMPMGNNDMERPLDPRARMMGGPPPQPNMPPMGMGTGDVDLRMPPMAMPMPVPAPVAAPLVNNVAPDQGMRDPRQQAPLPVPPPRDPRSVGNVAGAPPLPRQPPLPKAAPQAAQSPSMAGMVGMANMAGMGEGVSDQEKAALIMQVLQLTNEQISMLPPEQRQSILLLKKQIAESSHR